MDEIKWGKGRDDEFRGWFRAELQHATDARLGLERQWISWLDQYRTTPPRVVRWPFEGASDETIPTIATDVDQLYAKFMQTVHAAPNIWSVSPLNERWVHTAKPLQDFLTLLDNQMTVLTYEISHASALSNHNKALAEIDLLTGKAPF